MKKIYKFCLILFLGLTIGLISYNYPKQIYAADDLHIEGTTIISYTGSSNRITVPNGITDIGEGAFENNQNIVEVILPETLKRIGIRSFSGCTNLSFINLDYVESFGEMAFQSTAMSEVIINDKIETLPLGLFAYAKLNSIVMGNNVLTIGDSVFYSCYNLTSVVMSDSVYSIGSQAFFNCSKLVNIVLSNNLEFLGSKSLNNTAISSIEIPGSVKVLENQVLGNCLNLNKVILNDGLEKIESNSIFLTQITKISIPKTVKTIDWNAISGNSELEEITVASENTEYIDDKGILYTKNYEHLMVVPKNYQSKIVTIHDGCQISDELAMAELKNVTKVVLPEGMIKLDHNTFQDSKNIEEILLPSTLKEISSGAFYGCIKLASIDLPDGLEMISDSTWWSGVFQYCSSLTEIVIPDSVKKIGPYTFNNCTNLERVVIPSGVEDYGTYQFSENPNLVEIKVKDGNVFAFSTDGVYYEIHDGKTYLTVYPAKKEGKIYNIPTSVENIAKNAFNSAAILEEVTIPSSVTYLGTHIFSYTTSLKKVTFNNEMKTLPQQTFFHSSVEEVILPDSLEKIDSMAFAFCEKMTSIDLPYGLKEIGQTAFYNSGLVNVVMPDSVISVDQSFMYCHSLESIKLSNSLKTLNASCFNGTKLKEITIPESMVEIPNAAFYNCQYLERVNLPKTISWFSKSSFSDCPLLREINIDPENPYIHELDGILYDEEYKELLYVNVDKVPEKIVLPDTLETIAPSAFEFNTTVKDITIPATLETVGYKAFNESNVEIVTYAEGYKSIPFAMFSRCRKLKTVNLPESLEKIEGGVFVECTSLEEFVIPDGVDITVAFSLFRYCSSLTKVTLPNDATSIPQYMFDHCVALQEVNIPEACNKIETYAFGYCKAITSFVLPKSIQSLEYNVFVDSSVKKLILLGDAPLLITSHYGSDYFPSTTTIFYDKTMKGYTSNSYKPYQKQLKQLKDNQFNDDIILNLVDNGDHTIELIADVLYSNQYTFYMKNSDNEYEKIYEGENNYCSYDKLLGGQTYEFKVETKILNNELSYLSSKENSIYIEKNNDDYQVDYLIAKISSIDNYANYSENELLEIVNNYQDLPDYLQTIVLERSDYNNLLSSYEAKKAYNADIAKITTINIDVSSSMNVGESQEISVSFPDGVVNNSYVLSSSDEKIATIENGKVVAKKAGKTVIKATAINGVTAEIEITVMEIIEIPENDNSTIYIVLGCIGGLIVIGGSIFATVFIIKRRGGKNE